MWICRSPKRESAVCPYLSETEKSSLKSCAISGLDRLEQIENIACNGTIAPRTGSTGIERERGKKVLAMLTVAISVLFGLIAFAAVAQIGAALDRGVRHHRAIRAELAADRRVVRPRALRPALLAAA